MVDSILHRKVILIMNSTNFQERIAALKEEQRRITDEIRKAKSEAKKQKIDVVAIALTLTSVTQSVLDAKTAYEEKGFFVEIETDAKTGLIRKWKLKNRRPKTQSVGGVVTSTPKAKNLSPDDLKIILPELPDMFKASDIQEALIRSGIGERKLQPGLGQILSGEFGKKVIEKVPGTDKGPGVRYRKVK